MRNIRSVKRGDVLISTRPISLKGEDSGIPQGTGFVCSSKSRGVLALIYLNEKRQQFEQIKIPQEAFADEFSPGASQHIPLTLALHFEIDVSGHDHPMMTPEREYQLISDLRINHDLTLKKGDRLLCVRTTGRLAFFETVKDGCQHHFSLGLADQPRLIGLDH